MDVILLQPDTLVNLTLLALIIPFTLYLLRLRDKDEATWWLVVYLAGTALSLVSYGLFTGIFWGAIVGSVDPSVPERALVRLPHFFSLIAAWGYLQFAYMALEGQFVREARYVRTATAFLILGIGTVLAYNYVTLERLNFGTESGTIALYGASIVGTALYAWALIVFVRKWRLLRRSSAEQDHRQAEAFGFYALLTCGALASTAFHSGTQIGIQMPGEARFLEPLLGIVFTFGLAFAFVNYSRKATTFQVKLVGLTLTAVLLVLASAVAITAETADEELQGEPIPSGQAFRFTSDARGGYELRVAAIGYDAERGENLRLDNNGARALALPFDFTFAGTTWDTVYAYSDGFVTVGGLIDTTWHKHRYIHRKDTHKIAPLFTNLNPSRGGGVFARVDPDRLVVTWHDVPHWYGAKEYNVSWREEPVRYGVFPTQNRVQLVLHASGAIDMIYDRVMIPPGLRTYGARGLVMGHALGEPTSAEQDFGAVFRAQTFASWDAQPSLTVPPGTSILEDLYFKYRSRLHGRLRLLAWLIVGSTLFVVAVVPYFYRWSLTRPLERLLDGMKRVESGELGVNVPVDVRDEVGRVTLYFNRMTNSLRLADAELRAYAEHLEERVEERTAELQAEKEKTEAQAARLAELDEAKSRFFANVSHELRTPLTLLLGPIRDALADGNRGTLVQQLPMMRRNGERLLALVERLLDLARLDAGRLRLAVAETNLVGITRRIVLAFASRAEREGLDLFFETTPERLDAWVDAERYEQVLSNLLTNAFKFTPEGGCIGVTLDADADAAVLSVRDTGEGIPAEVLPHVFDRFRQGDDAATRRHEGAGIGLALVHELVTLHGGTITVESAPGLGSTFTVRLPLGKDHVDADALAPTPAIPEPPFTLPHPDDVSEQEFAESQAPTRADATVLVVEDHDDMRAYLRTLLAPHYHVEEADDGQAGLEAARRLAAEGRTPDLVISDVMMPGMDGYTLCHVLKENEALGHVPVVLLTARADEESKLEGLGEGADDYLAKPFSADELLARCENLIEVRRRLRARFSGEVVVRPTDVVVEREEADWLEEVKAICDERLSDSNFGVDWLADELGVSARTLRRRMKATSGLTPGAFLRTLRMERAAQFLEQGAGVAEAAAAVGYTDPEWFSRAFRQGFGVPPSTYAEQAGE